MKSQKLSLFFFAPVIIFCLIIQKCNIEPVSSENTDAEKSKITVILPENINPQLYRVFIITDSTDSVIYYEKAQNKELQISVSFTKKSKVIVDAFKGDMCIYSGSADVMAGQTSSVFLTAQNEERISPPANLHASLNSKQVILSWSASQSAESYRIYRAKDTLGVCGMLDSVTDTSYTDTTVEMGETYFYKVIAKNAATISLPSEYITVVVPDKQIEIPATPEQVFITIEDHLVKITWNSVYNADYYKIYRKDSSNAPVINIGETEATFFIDSLNEELLHPGYCVSSVNSQGSSEKSDIKWIEIAVSIPQTPSGITGIGISENSIQINWDKVKNATQYIVQWSTESDGICQSDTVDTNFAVLGSLKPSSSYYCKVLSINSAGQSRVSSVIEVKTLDPAVLPPGVPVLETSVLSDKLISISWESVVNASFYIVYRSLSSSDSFTIIDTVISTAIIDSGLQPNTTYYYRAKAFNNAGMSEFSRTVSAKTAQSLLPPTTITSGIITDKSIEIKWEIVSGADSYKIYRSGTESGVYKQVGTSVDSVYTDSNLIAATTYYYKISSVKGSQESELSSVFSAKTKGAPPAVPVGLRVTASSSSSITVEFNTVSGAISYIVFSGMSSGSLTALDTITTNTYIHSSLQASTTYYYAVAAMNLNGTSEKSSIVNATTNSDDAPLTPGGLTATASSSTSITIQFNSVSNATGYKLYWSIDGNNYSVLNLTSTSYTHTGLMANTTYYYKISAVKGSLESAQSSSVSAKTAAATKIAVIGSNCNGCGKCVSACTRQAIVKSGSKYIIDASKCDGCEKCVSKCSRRAITMK